MFSTVIDLLTIGHVNTTCVPIFLLSRLTLRYCCFVGEGTCRYLGTKRSMPALGRSSDIPSTRPRCSVECHLPTENLLRVRGPCAIAADSWANVPPPFPPNASHSRIALLSGLERGGRGGLPGRMGRQPKTGYQNGGCALGLICIPSVATKAPQIADAQENRLSVSRVSLRELYVHETTACVILSIVETTYSAPTTDRLFTWLRTDFAGSPRHSPAEKGGIALDAAGLCS